MWTPICIVSSAAWNGQAKCLCRSMEKFLWTPTPVLLMFIMQHLLCTVLQITIFVLFEYPLLQPLVNMSLNARFTRNRMCMKTYTHIYVARTCEYIWNICEFLGNNYCIPKRWPMGSLQQSLPHWLKPLVTPLSSRNLFLYWRFRLTALTHFYSNTDHTWRIRKGRDVRKSDACAQKTHRTHAVCIQLYSTKIGKFSENKQIFKSERHELPFHEHLQFSNTIRHGSCTDCQQRLLAEFHVSSCSFCVTTMPAPRAFSAWTCAVFLIIKLFQHSTSYFFRFR